MGNSSPDISDAIIELMCQDCPNFKKCHNPDGDANYDQMIDCILMDVLEVNKNNYPKKGEFTPYKKPIVVR